MFARRIAAAAVAAVSSLVLAASAGAAAWVPVTSGHNGNTERLGLNRASDGTLRMVYLDEVGALSTNLLYRTISPAGALSAPITVAPGWASLSNPAIVPAPAGALRIFFGGIHSTNSQDPNQNLNTAVSTDGGATWTVPPGSVATDDYAYASDMVATVRPDLTPYEAWASTAGALVHAGLDAATPNANFQAALGGCCGYDTNLVSDATGQLYLAWYSNATNHSGVYVQAADVNGAPLGAPVAMPGVAENGQTGSQIGRVGLAARPQGGVFAAYHGGYPSSPRVVVWPVGSAAATVVGHTREGTGNANVADAATSDGRLWVFWRDGNRMFARRSNTTVTKWGPTIDAGVPGKTQDIYGVDGNAMGGALDLFATAAVGETPQVITYWQRLLPAFSISVDKGTAVKGQPVKVTFTITDAGAPVPGAVVKFGGNKVTTGSNGSAKTKVGPFSHPVTITATVTAPLYQADSAKVHIKPKKH